MTDKLNSRGLLGGSLGLPANRGADLLRGPARQSLPTGTRDVAVGQQIGATAVSLIRGTFLRNLGLVGAHVQRLAGKNASTIAADSSGAPEAPTVTGWDGLPLDKAGL